MDKKGEVNNGGLASCWMGFFYFVITPEELYQDFLLIKKSIEKITKPLSFWMNDKLVKPKIRISNGALENVGEFFFLQRKLYCGYM